MDPCQTPLAPTTQPVPVGTSIRIHVDMLLDLIQSERQNAAAEANAKLQKYQQLFNELRQSSMAEVAAAKQQRQTQIPGSQPDASQSSAQAGITEHLMCPDRRDLPYERFVHLQNTLRPLGIDISEDTSDIQFDPGWKIILAHIGMANTPGVIDALAHKLHVEKNAIESLLQKNQAHEQRYAKTIESYEQKIASLNAEIARLQAHAQAASLPPRVNPEVMHRSSYSAPPSFGMPFAAGLGPGLYSHSPLNLQLHNNYMTSHPQHQHS